jgi:hypothetical protein
LEGGGGANHAGEFIRCYSPLRRNGKWKMENGKWKMENGKWKMENGKWKMENGKWKS